MPLLDPRTFPRPPALEKVSKHLLIKWPERLGGGVIADTQAGFWVLETYHPPTYYIPPSDISIPLNKSNSRSTMCEWKGLATYYDIAVPGQAAGAARTASSERVHDRAWSYPSPTPRFAAIKDYVSFYAAGVPWECYVDGEKVEAQEGGFYGGWLTSEIGNREGVKGRRGTEGW